MADGAALGAARAELLLLHDARTTDLVTAIQLHGGEASEGGSTRLLPIAVAALAGTSDRSKEVIVAEFAST